MFGDILKINEKEVNKVMENGSFHFYPDKCILRIRSRICVNSEELLTMRQVIKAVGGYYASLRDAERARLMAEETARRAAIEAAEAERRATIEAARALIPPRAYEISLPEMGLSARVLGHLERAELANVGEVMERFAEGDEGLLRLDGIGPKSLAEIKRCIEALALPEVEEAVPTEEEIVAEAAPEAVEEALAEEVVAAEEAPVAIAEEVTVAPGAAPEAAEKAPVEEEGKEVEEAPLVSKAPELLLEEEEVEDPAKLEEERKRERRLRRQLVFDEELGVVVAHRRRKRDEDSDDWEKYQG